VSGYLERRRDIVELADKLTKHRAELLATVNIINEGISALVQESERILPEAANEAEATGGKAAVKMVTYASANPSAPDIEAHTNPSKRHCSNCGESGHRATTCTNNRKLTVIPEDGEPVVEKVRKKRRPLTAEEKAVLTKRLVKARAARGKK
jgi:hypothetical protein